MRYVVPLPLAGGVRGGRGGRIGSSQRLDLSDRPTLLRLGSLRSPSLASLPQAGGRQVRNSAIVCWMARATASGSAITSALAKCSTV